MSSYDKPGSLDGAIDEAVREMMQVDPRPGLRHRVARSISAPPQRRRGFRMGFAALAVAMVVLASMVVWRSSRPETPVHAPQVAETTPAVPASPLAGPQAVAAPMPTPVPVPAPTRRGRRSEPSPEAIFGPRSGRVAAASIPPAPIESPAAETWIELPSISGDPAAIAPIRIEPIRVTPLTIQPLVVGALPRRSPFN